ncbi:MAG: GNAT family N-acetyltransferase [Solirubrobacteraceae bacterium]|nr:GNAT family N-acetyltransferase [Patulibacter sp.]
MTGPSIDATAALLRDVFPGSARVGDPTYLRWLYEASPFGPVIQANRTDGAGLAAHYAVVPVELSVDGAPVSGALSLNTAVSERARGGGVFVTLAEETYALARARGVRVVTGVANANSTPGFERRLGFANHGPLPVSVLVPRPGTTRGVRRGFVRGPAVQAGIVDCADIVLRPGAAGDLLDGAEPLLAPGAAGLARAWTVDGLRWRLASPGAAYALHRTDRALVVSTAERRAGLHVGVILAAFAAEPLDAREVGLLVRSVCVAHRAPVALHAGFNDRVRFRGRRLPDRFRPSPLNLITRSLEGAPVPRPARFEFLDFDAY